MLKQKKYEYSPHWDPFREESLSSIWDPVTHDMLNFSDVDSAWNAERERRTNAVHLEAKAYPPSTKVKNEIFPRPHEVYNGTTCLWAEKEHPAYTMKNQETYHVKCTFMKVNCEGPRFYDVGCPHWERREPKPKKGYTPGIDI